MGSARRPAYVEENRTFALEGLFGKRTLDIYNVPSGWYVKSIRYDNKDVFDIPTVFENTGARTLEIILSSRGAVVSGRAVDERGEPVAAGRVLMFPAGKERWGAHEYSSARISRSGGFRLGPRRAGEYVLVALGPEAADVDSRDFKRLAKLAEHGERVTLQSEEERALELRVVRAPDARDE
jgi:hypothetical protein